MDMSREITADGHNSYSLGSIARLLGITVNTVRLLAERGALEVSTDPKRQRRLPSNCYNRGNHLRVTIDSLKRFISNPISIDQKPHKESRLRVVVAEDDLAMLKLYRCTMESWNLPISLEFLNNGLDGLITISKRPPDILITDLKMPGVDGFEMLQALQKLEAFSRMKIIVVTGLNRYDIEEKGGMPNDVQLLGKSPVPFGEIKELVQGLTNKLFETRKS